MKMRLLKITGLFFICALVFAGCAVNLLPSSQAITKSPWQTYQSAEESYNKIQCGLTTAEELKKLGIDPLQTPNIRILAPREITNIFLPNSSVRKEDLHGGIQQCIDAKSNCIGYSINPEITDSKRTGSFWLDLLRFRRETKISGWNFSGLILIVDKVVVYKDPAGGIPKIDREQKEKNPLGPLQDLGIGGAITIKSVIN